MCADTYDRGTERMSSNDGERSGHDVRRARAAGGGRRNNGASWSVEVGVRFREFLLATTAIMLVVAACVVGQSSLLESAPASSSPAASQSLSASSSPADSSIIGSDQLAAQLVLASDPRFRGVQPVDPALVGQSSWYRVQPDGEAFIVTVRIGWGDCPTGCASTHEWIFRVSPDRTIRQVSESGPDVPLEAVAKADGSAPDVSGVVTAGPVCAVESVPPDPACAARPVAGAVLVVSEGSGGEVARVTSSAQGTFRVALPAGRYVLTPQPVVSLLGTASPIDFAVPPEGPPVTFQVRYDTGIR